MIEFKDALSSTLLSVLDSWNVDFKTYRYQVKNIPPGESKLMCSITFSHHDKKTVLIKNNVCMVTTATLNDKSSSLLSNGCCGDTPEPIDAILSTKLSNIWSQRQSIKGEAGETFQTTDLIVRAINLFSSTGFKGLLIEITSNEDATEEEFAEKLVSLQSLLKDIEVKDMRISDERLYFSGNDYICDLAHQYVRVLNF